MAHSDGDVAIHALCDALLGALALGDIGTHFPPADERFRGIDSRALLREVIALIHARGWRLGNADLTIICERPKILPHALTMRQNLASDCAVSVEDIAVKATTTEGLGFTGRREGIAAQAAVLLQRS
jgi:2-C-methyl-D-erythritol 2,4-cyclodiphosphate synthase